MPPSPRTTRTCLCRVCTARVYQTNSVGFTVPPYVGLDTTVDGTTGRRERVLHNITRSTLLYVSIETNKNTNRFTVVIGSALPFTLFSLYLCLEMQRKNASKGKSAGLSRLEKVLVPAQATTNYRGPVTRRQGLRSAKIEVELGKIFLLRRWIAAY